MNVSAGKVIKSLSQNHLKRVAIAVKKAIFPTRCLACGSLFHAKARTNKDFFLDDSVNVFERLITPFLCSACSFGFLPVAPPICPWCGIMFKSRQGEDHLCGECMSSSKRFRIARSLGIYEKALMDAIHCFKYKGKIQLARPLGTMLFKSFISSWNAHSVDVIMPVPLHNRKLKMRGFNPSLLLVRHWTLFASELKINMPIVPVVRDVLEKIRWTEPQTGLVRKKRIKNVKNTFSINDSSKIEGKRILLVDDVYTTGATANECAKVLLKGGALHVDVLTLARTMWV